MNATLPAATREWAQETPPTNRTPAHSAPQIVETHSAPYEHVRPRLQPLQRDDQHASSDPIRHVAHAAAPTYTAQTRYPETEAHSHHLPLPLPADVTSYYDPRTQFTCGCSHHGHQYTPATYCTHCSSPQSSQRQAGPSSFDLVHPSSHNYYDAQNTQVPDHHRSNNPSCRVNYSQANPSSQNDRGQPVQVVQLEVHLRYQHR
ncbi:hypothetical protein C8J57DRAFT_178860 [Mycena rebaudengoi]|nr:hypothetical protein C8J57DRAFT_178860 [Mycena rebaudengoi]